MRDSDGAAYVKLPAVAGAVRDLQQLCVVCAGRRFQIMSDGPYQAWLKCLECGERQPSGVEEHQAMPAALSSEAGCTDKCERLPARSDGFDQEAIDEIKSVLSATKRSRS